MISRGKNFTEREKHNLIELIQKYKHIIENKCTNKVWTVTKHKTWEAITTAFNRSAEVHRTKKQLHTAYLNFKRSSRQNISNDNMSVIAPDGSVFTPVLGCIESQLLDVIDERVSPECNNSDSTSSYDKNDKDANVFCEVSHDTSEPDTNSVAQSKKVRNARKLQLKKKKFPKSNDSLINQYYNVKLESAIIEKRTKLLEYRLNVRKTKLLDLEIKMKQKQYERLLLI